MIVVASWFFLTDLFTWKCLGLYPEIPKKQTGKAQEVYLFLVSLSPYWNGLWFLFKKLPNSDYFFNQ